KGIRKHSVLRSDHGPFNQVLEFAHIAGPIVCRECIHCCFWYLLNPLPHAPGEYLYEVQDQLRYVIPALPQGRYEDRKYVQPIVEIAAEFVACDHIGQVAMSRSHQTDVDAMCTAASQSLELLFL